VERVLVVVHPGSACGSATYNLGRTEAQSARGELADELTRWDGGVVVVDGELSDELPYYPHLANAIDGALARAAAAGHLSVRLEGDDPDQVAVIEALAAEQNWKERGVTCAVTGAWFHPKDGSGCVGGVHKALLALGIGAEVSNHAVCIDPEEVE